MTEQRQCITYISRELRKEQAWKVGGEKGAFEVGVGDMKQSCDGGAGNTQAIFPLGVLIGGFAAVRIRPRLKL